MCAGAGLVLRLVAFAGALVVCHQLRPTQQSFELLVESRQQSWWPGSRWGSYAEVDDYVVFVVGRTGTHSGDTQYWLGALRSWVPVWPVLPVTVAMEWTNCLIGTCILFYVLWQVPLVSQFLELHAAASYANAQRRPWSLVLATLSHSDLGHLVHNAVALLGVRDRAAAVVKHVCGTPPTGAYPLNLADGCVPPAWKPAWLVSELDATLLMFTLVAGAAAATAAVVWRGPGDPTDAIGASGAVMALLGFAATAEYRRPSLAQPIYPYSELGDWRIRPEAGQYWLAPDSGPERERGMLGTPLTLWHFALAHAVMHALHPRGIDIAMHLAGLGLGALAACWAFPQ
eukprot:TRINITY_DN25607_c0_g1_i1.p1 TRINITY_DN25607_c0_g1~~TRINITY_DN25607_c0_g1_i1.p1  ORF type:complete len:343 (+),score=69.14 TRINITY_DN25607_c0_g1_i1:94-1122(+)